MKRRTFKKLFLALLLFFILLQAIRPARNTGTAESATDITHVFPVPDTVMGILKRSCYDCHSNHTAYPWYAAISPVSLWLAHHVDEGKKELNFSEFSTYSNRRKKSKLSSIAEQVEEREMPLKSYTLIHTNANLTDEEIKKISAWVDTAKATLARTDD